MIGLAKIQNVHSILKQAMNFKNGKVIINSNTHTYLNTCLSELQILSDNSNVGIAKEFMTDIGDIDGYDVFEVVTKLALIIELSNRMAKSANATKQETREFYKIKYLGIEGISKLDTVEEITDKGSGFDSKKECATYSLQVDKYEGRAVVSWHMSNIAMGSPLSYLIESSDKNYTRYDGQDVTQYSPIDRDDIELAIQMKIEPRYNEKGLIALIDMFETRRGIKSEIKEFINQNFPGLGIPQSRIDSMLNGEVLAQEEEVYELGEYSGIKLVERIIEEKIENVYFSEPKQDIASKCSKLKSHFADQDEEKNVRNLYFLTKMIDTVDFNNNSFEDIIQIIENKIKAIEMLGKVYEFDSLEDANQGYEMLHALEMIGIDDFEKGVTILEKVRKDIFNNEADISDVKIFVEKTKNVFSSFDFDGNNTEPQDVIDITIMLVADDVKNNNINVKDFKDSQKTSQILKSVKQRINNRFKEINNENIEGTISVDEILEFVDDAQCDKEEILEAADALLAFVFQRDNTKLQNAPNAEVFELATEELPAKSILDLRNKLIKGDYRGGGRY